MSAIIRRATCVKVLFAFVFLLLFSAGAVAKVIAVQGEGWREDVDGVRVVHLKGTPKEIGLQHGILLKNEINALSNYFFVEHDNVFGASIADLKKGAAVLQKNIPPDYVEELKGISEGSGVEYDKILMMNTFLDVVSAAWVGVRIPGCSNFAALGDASKNKNIVHGRNLDWSANDTLVAANTVFIITSTDGIPFASLSWPGMAGTLTGLNNEKISMGEMTSMSSEATLDGIPIMLLLRKVLQYSKGLDDAYAILEKGPRTTGYNVLVTDAKLNDGFIAEMTSRNIIKLPPQNGILMHTNHFVSPKLKSSQMKYMYMFGNGKKSDSFYRYERLTNLLNSNNGNIDVESAESFLGDRYDLAENKFSDKLANSVCQANTLQSVVMLPQTGELYVAIKSLPAPTGVYVRLKLIPSQKPE